jgi:hypothetical protein
MMVTQYLKDYNRSLFYDYKRESSKIFMNNLGSLGGNAGDIFSLRYRLIKGKITDKEEYKRALSVATKEITEWLQVKHDNKSISNTDNLINSIKDLLHS